MNKAIERNIIAVAIYDPSRNGTVEQASDNVRCDIRFESFPGLVDKLAKLLNTGERIERLQLISHTSTAGDLVFGKRPESRALKTFINSDHMERFKRLFSTDTTDSWRLALWGCESASPKRSEFLKKLADTLEFPISAHGSVLTPDDFGPDGLKPTELTRATTYRPGQTYVGDVVQKYKVDWKPRGDAFARVSTDPAFDPIGSVIPTVNAGNVPVMERLQTALAGHLPDVSVEAGGVLADPQARFRGSDGMFEVLMDYRLIRIFERGDYRGAHGFWLDADPAAVKKLKALIKQLHAIAAGPL